MGGLLHRWRHRPRCYVICAVARSGSNMLRDGLRATCVAGKPKQYFCEKLEPRYGEQHHLDPAADYAGYVRGVVRAAATPNDAFGCKLMGWDLKPFLERLRKTGAFGPADASELALLRAALPRVQFIRLRRRDQLRQAISKARALQTDIWRSDEAEQPPAAPEFNFKLISHCIKNVTREDQIWTNFFARNALQPLELVYEDFCRDYGSSLQTVLDFLEVAAPPGLSLDNPRTMRQADAVTDEWENRYRSLMNQDSPALTYV